MKKYRLPAVILAVMVWRQAADKTEPETEQKRKILSGRRNLLMKRAGWQQ